MTGTSEADRMAARAEALRRASVERLRTEQADMEARPEELRREQVALKARITAADKDAAQDFKDAQASLKVAQSTEAKADKAEWNDPDKARELRESAARGRADAEQLTKQAERAQAEAQRLRSDEGRLAKDIDEAQRSYDRFTSENSKIEQELDDLENKSALLHRVERNRSEADRHDAEAARLRELGDTKAADFEAGLAKDTRTWADKYQSQADAIIVDDAVFERAGLERVATTTAEATGPSAEEPPATARVEDHQPTIAATFSDAGWSADPVHLDAVTAASIATADGLDDELAAPAAAPDPDTNLLDDGTSQADEPPANHDDQQQASSEAWAMPDLDEIHAADSSWAEPAPLEPALAGMHGTGPDELNDAGLGDAGLGDTGLNDTGLDEAGTTDPGPDDLS